MTIKDLKNKNICIWGLGIENQALIEFLMQKKVNCRISVCDQKDKKELSAFDQFKKYDIEWCLGKKCKLDFSNFDLIVRSPGSVIHKDKKIKLGQAKITSAINLFLDFCPSKNIIGVTGTKGKGSTASLITCILKTAKKRTWLGGNIGIAPFSFINKIKKTDWVVLELSSFQLEDITSSPRIAVITNFTKEHLAPADPNNFNYHKTMSEYWLAKLGIAKWQDKKDYLIVNDKLKKKIAGHKIKSKIKYFTKSDLISQLPGEHNKENIAAAIEVAKLAKVNKTDITKAIARFEGLIYRIQLIKQLRGVKYYNDSFATTPEATMTALRSFTEPITLIAGGADKGSNFKELAKVIKQKVKFVVLLKGQATPRIKRELLAIKYPKDQMVVLDNFKTAVKIANKQAKIGEIMLLSTACASFGMFVNYKERGKLFTELVERLK